MPFSVPRDLKFELQRLELTFEAAICFFGAGIVAYFALPNEPPIHWIALLTVLMTIAAWAFRGRTNIGPLFLMSVFVGVGLGRAAWHTNAVEAPILPIKEAYYEIEGWVAAVEKSGTRERWRVKVHEINGLERADQPAFVRVRIDTTGFEVGDAVRFSARLKAPPPPVVPGGYNSARAAYYNKIGGYGFAVSKPEAVRLPNLGRMDEFKRKISAFRFAYAERIYRAAPENTAGLQTALLTGVRTYIPETQTVALRGAGLAHILAISGLHMGLVAGGSFFVITLLLAVITPVSRSIDVRKPAAGFGILVAIAYLSLSGASVATQRAFIMTVIVFLAVILDRRAFSLRSVGIAALITLWLHPEALLSPGFQMSFAAVAALVVTYRAWDKRRTVFRDRSPLGRFWFGLKSLTVTSLVAGTITSVFAAFHFNRVANFGLLGNLLAMPIFSFWVMPAALLVYVASPFGLEGLPLWVMGVGIELILWISEWVVGLPKAIGFLVQASNTVLLIFVIGFLALCLYESRVGKAAGATIMAMSCIMWALTPVPDLRISQDGSVAVWDKHNRQSLGAANQRKDNFGRQVFAEQSGRPGFKIVSLSDFDDARCDGQGCLLRREEFTLATAKAQSALAEDCAQADLVLWQGKRPPGMVIRQYCKAEIIDQASLARTGALNVYINKNGTRMDPVFKPNFISRPWGRAYRNQ